MSGRPGSARNGRAAELVLLRSTRTRHIRSGWRRSPSKPSARRSPGSRSAGCRILSREPSLDCMAAGVTFATPEGLRFEIHTPTRDKLYGRRYPTHGVGPSRMDHLNLTTPDPAATRRSSRPSGGLRLSEKHGRRQPELDVWRQPPASHRRYRAWQGRAASLFLRVQGIQRIPQARRSARSIRQADAVGTGPAPSGRQHLCLLHRLQRSDDRMLGLDGLDRGRRRFRSEHHHQSGAPGQCAHHERLGHARAARMAQHHFPFATLS